MPVIAGKLQCDGPRPSSSGETHTQQKQLWRFYLQRLCSQWNQSPFIVNFAAILSRCFLQGLQGDLPMACRAAGSMEGSTYSDYLGHLWDPNISPVATAV